VTQLLLPIGWRPFVFSIRPRFLAMFRSGSKVYEFRRRRPSVRAGERHLVYETSPTSAIVAWASIGEVLDNEPDKVWELAGPRGGITRREFDEYFSNPSGGLRERAVAIEMKMTWMDKPIALPASMVAPQSWARWRGPWPIAA